MNPLYEKAKDLILIRRTSDNKEFEEYPLIVQPQSVLMTDPTNDIVMFNVCGLSVAFARSASYSESGSYAHTASFSFQNATSSWAWFALSSSFANSASYTVSSSNAISASWADTASFALEASAAYSAAFASDAVSASYAFSASYAESASYGTNFYAPRVTSSYVSVSVAIQTNQLTASNILVRGIALGTASYALNANSAVNSAFATTAGIATFAVSASTAFSATSSISASHANVADVVSGTVTNAIYAQTASYAYTSSYEMEVEISSSWASASLSSSAALYAVSASEAGFALLASSSLGTRGLNVVNLPPMPNGDIQFGVGDSTPAVYDTIMSIGASGTASESQTHMLVHLPENNKIYGAGWYGSVYVFNDPDNDFTNVNSCSLIAGNFASQMVYASGSLYVINGSSVGPATGSITRVNINNITSQSVVVQGLPGGTALIPLVTDGNFLLTQGNGLIYKWDLSGSLIQSTPCISASVTVAVSHGGIISTDKQWAYFSTTAGIITKVKVSDVTNYTCSRHEQTNFPGGPFNASVTDDMCYLNGYVYTSVESNGNVIRMDANTLEFVAYPAAFSSYGMFTDGVHLYALMGSEIWVYLNGDIDSGPIRFGIVGAAHELAITNGGRVVYSNWTTLDIYRYFLPITQLGINKQPSYTLDIAGGIVATTITSPTISASNNITTLNETFTGTLTMGGAALIYGGSSGKIRIDTGSVRAPTISSSAALLGRVTNTRFSQSFAAAASMSYTQSLGTISQDGMYRLTIASTIGFYSGAALVNQPKWNFIHTDRFGAYTLPPSTPLTPTTLITPAGYDYAFAFGSDYIFQAVAGSPIAYYYGTSGNQMSSTDCSASFFTTVTVTQIMSGSVTGSI